MGRALVPAPADGPGAADQRDPAPGRYLLPCTRFPVACAPGGPWLSLAGVLTLRQETEHLGAFVWLPCTRFPAACAPGGPWLSLAGVLRLRQETERLGAFVWGAFFAGTVLLLPFWSGLRWLWPVVTGAQHVVLVPRGPAAGLLARCRRCILHHLTSSSR